MSGLRKNLQTSAKAYKTISNIGYKEDMMRALELSASIIKRDLDYFEFKEVIDFINKTS